jgi:HK97 family phage major capsid protein
MDTIIDRNLNELTALREKCISENRDPDNQERARANFLLAEIEIKESDFFFNTEEPDRTPIDTRYAEGYKPASAYAREAKKPYTIRTYNDKKDYRSLYGSNDENFRWIDSESTFFEALFSGRFHPDLKKRSLVESVPSSGGYIVPTEYAAKIHNVSLENELIMPKATVIPMKSNEIKLPATEIGDHSSNLYGGFTASYTAEEGSLTEANPKLRQITLQANKLTGLLKFSNELIADSVNGEAQILDIAGRGLAWYRDKAFIKGSGAGEPLGILNSGCLLAQAKETGQAADSIVYENLTGMLGKLYPGSFKNSIWIFHQSAISNLLELSIAVGTGGSFIPVMSESNGVFKILSRPCVFTEKTEILGDQGDALLCDLSQYAVGLTAGMRIDTSQHLYFETDMAVARLIERHDALPLWDTALTLEDGSTECSPFVTLAERA